MKQAIAKDNIHSHTYMNKLSCNTRSFFVQFSFPEDAEPCILPFRQLPCASPISRHGNLSL
ncbi:hypothetical protein FRX31_014634 [Thalictrum thalictroides]|uniref:Uncharacterized protein n=1 Tax=Thalictrum thalictroides TaxID=46969 RepID=A0A7J6WEF0_THATH|nr:hypothetical protein FRX31_014634 [Thalictrum thalictroides]